MMQSFVAYFEVERFLQALFSLASLRLECDSCVWAGDVMFAGDVKIWNVSSGDLILTANDVYLKSIVFSDHGKVLLLVMIDHGNSEVEGVFACNVAG